MALTKVDIATKIAEIPDQMSRVKDNVPLNLNYKKE